VGSFLPVRLFVSLTVLHLYKFTSLTTYRRMQSSLVFHWFITLLFQCMEYKGGDVLIEKDRNRDRVDKTYDNFHRVSNCSFVFESRVVNDPRLDVFTVTSASMKTKGLQCL
jgi:hypothetical protein